MKKLPLISLFFVLLFAQTINAQTKFGFKASYTHFLTQEEVSYAAIDSRSITHEVSFIEMTPATSIGVFTQSNMGFLFFQSEALYSQHSTQFQVESYINDDIDGQVLSEEYKNLDLNIVAGVNKKNWRFGLGPKFHINLDVTSNLDQLAFYTEKRKSITQGFQGLVGYNFGRLHIDVRYERDFSTVGNHIYFDDEKAAFTNKIKALSLHAGYGF